MPPNSLATLTKMRRMLYAWTQTWFTPLASRETLASLLYHPLISETSGPEWTLLTPFKSKLAVNSGFLSADWSKNFNHQHVFLDQPQKSDPHLQLPPGQRTSGLVQTAQKKNQFLSAALLWKITYHPAPHSHLDHCLCFGMSPVQIKKRGGWVGASHYK